MAEKSVKHLIVDSGSFIRNFPISEVADKVYTIKEVVSEIRDKATRQRLQVLPYEIIFRNPTPEAIKIVTDFSKKTGDFPSLSAVDIRLLALVYQVEKETVGTDHIKTVPDTNITWSATRGNVEKTSEIAGFYIKTETGKTAKPVLNTDGDEVTSVSGQCVSEQEEDSVVIQDEDSVIKQDVPDSVVKQDVLDSVVKQDVPDSVVKQDVPNSVVKQDGDSVVKQDGDSVVKQEGDSVVIQDEDSVVKQDVLDSVVEQDIPDSVVECTGKKYFEEGDMMHPDILDEYEGSDDDDDDDECDDDGGWITPANLQDVRLSLGANDKKLAHVAVGCMTTDFAMQNVLIQMGLNVVAADGMLIRRAKNYILRCYSCYKLTKNMSKEFCFHCGNKTLRKVSMTVNEDGTIRYYLSLRHINTKRGMQYTLPKPRGGKHANNPHLVEDQPFPQQRVSKRALKKVNILEDDYVCGTSPFSINDTTSRAAMLGIRDNFKNRKRFGNRK